MIKITFGPEEVTSAFICKLADLGITNVDRSTVGVAVKTLRDGSGGAEAEVSFTTINSTVAANTSMATANEQEQEEEQAGEDNTNSAEPDNSADDVQGTSIFGN